MQLKVFSIIKNLHQLFEKGKMVDDIDVLWPRPAWANASVYTKNAVNKAANEIENNFYSLNDFKVYLLCLYIQFPKLNLMKLNRKECMAVKSWFSKERLDKDKLVFAALPGDPEKKLYLLWGLDDKGFSKVHELIKQGKLSPIFWMRFKSLFYGIKHANKESEEHTRFRKIMNLIENTLTKKEFANG